MIYLFIQTRRRRLSREVAAQLETRFADGQNWTPVFESVLNRDHVALEGVASYSAIGGLLAGWPRCHIALVASPEEFFVVAGPYTRRGLAMSLLTLTLEFSLSRFWLPAIHGSIFLVELWQRRINWGRLRACSLRKLRSSGSVKSVSIDKAIVYGLDPLTQHLWFRLPEKQIDEFVELREEDRERADEFIAFVGLMQKAGNHEYR